MPGGRTRAEESGEAARRDVYPWRHLELGRLEPGIARKNLIASGGSMGRAWKSSNFVTS